MNPNAHVGRLKKYALNPFEKRMGNSKAVKYPAYNTPREEEKRTTWFANFPFIL